MARNNVLTLPRVGFAVDSPLVGVLVGHDAERGVLVDFEGNRQGPVVARSTVVISEAALHEPTQVLLIFEHADPSLPIIVGLLRPVDRTFEVEPVKDVDAHVDGRRVTLEGQDEVVLRCGKASIVLRRNGRVIIKGAEVVSQSSGTNRIRGGTGQIN